MLKAYYRVSILDANKKVIRMGRKKVSRSFLIGFLGALYRLMSQNSYQSQDISNTSRNVSSSYAALYLNSIGGGDKIPAFISSSYQLGIVVGTGTNTVSPSDYALQTIINHGTSAGQLEYFGMLIDKTVVAAPNATIDIERIFRNTSSGSITINEIGVYGINAIQDYLHCFIRDKLSVGVVVSNNEYVKVTYTLQITV